MKTEKTDEGRRRFLKPGAVSAPAAAVALTAAPDSADAAETDAPQEGLRKTAHVKAYLDSARF